MYASIPFKSNGNFRIRQLLPLIESKKISIIKSKHCYFLSNAHQIINNTETVLFSGTKEELLTFLNNNTL